MNAPLTTSAILDQRPSQTATERLARLFDAHHERLFRLALRLAADREEARDLVQEAFLRAARKPSSVPDGDQPGEAWLVRTLVNLCKDRFRRVSVRSRVHSSMKQAEGDPRRVENEVIARTAVRAALGRLSPRRRAVIALHEIDGTPVREVARLLGISEVTVRWHLLSARRELAGLLVEVRR